MTLWNLVTEFLKNYLQCVPKKLQPKNSSIPHNLFPLNIPFQLQIFQKHWPKIILSSLKKFLKIHFSLNWQMEIVEFLKKELESYIEEEIRNTYFTLWVTIMKSKLKIVISSIYLCQDKKGSMFLTRSRRKLQVNPPFSPAKFRKLKKDGQ